MPVAPKDQWIIGIGKYIDIDISQSKLATLNIFALKTNLSKKSFQLNVFFLQG